MNRKPFYVKRCGAYPMGAKTEDSKRHVIYVNKFELYKENEKIDEVTMPVESPVRKVEEVLMMRNHIKDNNEITWRKPTEEVWPLLLDLKVV